MGEVELDLAVCALCNGLSGEFSVFRVRVLPELTFNLSVCCNCYEPLPGPDEDNANYEDLIGNF